MGFSPQQVNQMSMWQYFAAVNGYIEANTPKDNAKLSASEVDELADWLYTGFEASRIVSTKTYLWGEDGPEFAGEVTFLLPR